MHPRSVPLPAFPAVAKSTPALSRTHASRGARAPRTGASSDFASSIGWRLYGYGCDGANAPTVQANAADASEQVRKNLLVMMADFLLTQGQGHSQTAPNSA